MSRAWLSEQDSGTSRSRGNATNHCARSAAPRLGGSLALPCRNATKGVPYTLHEKFSARRAVDAATQIYVCGGGFLLGGRGPAVGRKSGGAKASDRCGF